MPLSESEARSRLQEHGQEHLMRFWDRLDARERQNLLAQIETIDFRLMQRLIDTWVFDEPPPEHFERIDPVPVVPVADHSRPDAREAWDAGEEALRAGRVGLILVAGGQGTRLGFDGPKGSYPIGPLTGKTLFEYHAEKICYHQNRYGCELPWYIMVSNTNHGPTETFFKEHDHFGLKPEQITFFQQRMVPCVDDDGRFMLDEPGHIAVNPNGHGGCIPAMVENGITADAKKRGVDVLSYFQVDNWAIRLVDPYYIGYHVQRNAEMSSKVHRKTDVREAVGVHCLCDGEYRVIEYSELDLYPQLLETDDQGRPVHFAGNPAIHILSVPFIERMFAESERFPWHRAHKKIPRLDQGGTLIEPDEPNGYKFETFVFDALRFITHEPLALEIARAGEYTPIKQYEGANSVVAARQSMNAYWGGWLEKAGVDVPRSDADVAVDIEISPAFSRYPEEFAEKAKGRDYDATRGIAIGPDGEVLATDTAASGSSR